MKRQPHYVRNGSKRVALAPAELRATVGPGYAVAVRMENGRAGGLLHLNTPTPTPDFEGAGIDANTLEASLDSFVGELKTLDRPIRGSEAEIVGGADVLRILSMNQRETYARDHANFLEQILDSHGIKTARTRVGGVKGRTVSLLLEEGDAIRRVLSVNKAGAQKIKYPGRLRPPLEIVPGRDNNSPIHSVEAGNMIIETAPAQLVCLLGSCVGVAIWDSKTLTGGMAHVLMPDSEGYVDSAARYADTAVPAMVEALIQAGCQPRRLQAHIAGGANVLFIGRERHRFRIGERNIENVRKSLEDLNIPILRDVTGGFAGRKMWVNLRTFDIKIKELPSDGVKTGRKWQ